MVRKITQSSFIVLLMCFFMGIFTLFTINVFAINEPSVNTMQNNINVTSDNLDATIKTTSTATSTTSQNSNFIIFNQQGIVITTNQKTYHPQEIVQLSISSNTRQYIQIKSLNTYIAQLSDEEQTLPLSSGLVSFGEEFIFNHMFAPNENVVVNLNILRAGSFQLSIKTPSKTDYISFNSELFVIENGVPERNITHIKTGYNTLPQSIKDCLINNNVYFHIDNVPVFFNKDNQIMGTAFAGTYIGFAGLFDDEYWEGGVHHEVGHKIYDHLKCHNLNFSRQFNALYKKYINNSYFDEHERSQETELFAGAFGRYLGTKYAQQGLKNFQLNVYAPDIYNFIDNIVNNFENYAINDKYDDVQVKFYPTEKAASTIADLQKTIYLNKGTTMSFFYKIPDDIIKLSEDTKVNPAIYQAYWTYKTPSEPYWHALRIDKFNSVGRSFFVGETGDYIIRFMRVYNRNIKQYADFTLRVQEPLQNQSGFYKDEQSDLVTTYYSLASSKISIKIKANNVAPNFSAKLYSQSGSSFNLLKTYTTLPAEYKLIGLSTGTYNFKIEMIDAKDVIQSQSLKLVVCDKLQNQSTVSTNKLLLGKSFTVNLEHQGGSSNAKYKVLYKQTNDEKWVIANTQSKSSGDQIVITPKRSGIYKLRIELSDEITHSNIEKSIIVYRKIQNTSTISSKAIPIGQSITITCQKKHGFNVPQYYVYYKHSDDSHWTKVTDQIFAAGQTIITPKRTGNYQVKIIAKESATEKSELIYNLIVYKPLINSTKISQNEIEYGNSVFVVCKRSQGYGTTKFIVEYKRTDDNSFTLVTKTAKHNENVYITPRRYGKYQVQVTCVRGSDRVVKIFDLTVKKPPQIQNQSCISCDTITQGQGVIVSCIHTGGACTTKYIIKYKRSTDKNWTLVKDNVVAKTNVKIIPKRSGNYKILIKAYDGVSSDTIYKDIKVAPTLVNTSSVKNTSVQFEKTVDVSCSSTGGTGQIKYAVFYKHTDEKEWHTAMKYSYKQNVNFTTPQKGNYTICIKAKDENNQVVKKYIEIYIHP